MMRDKGPITFGSGFYDIPAADGNVFEVKESVPADLVVALALRTLESLIGMARDGAQDGIETDRACGMEMLLEMVRGLVGSLEGQV
ncbi:hypothetical protein [Dyella jiangningensis]|uniref:DUF3077 domain-containing protein n=1 Tax=Dyella jiangningensis TaxID=1379159 RepID=A0A328P454_9GAMM|nr:hypothetical protein [Dyella jiangningensis]RAO75796.1 hypothetical protein CA260_17310 [Dyella jiangningensis]